MAKHSDNEAWLMHQLRLFLLALQFFTRLPIPQWVGFREEWMGQTGQIGRASCRERV